MANNDLFAYLDNVFEYKIYRIRWTCMGSNSNPPVILVHGTPFSSLEWLPYAQAWKRDYRVYLFDLAGFGASQIFAPGPESERDVSYALQGELFAALCQHLGFNDSNKPHVIAHDIGGHTALRAHILHSIKYASLCLLDPVAVNPWGSPFMRLIMANGHVFEGVPPGVFEGMLREYVQSAAFTKLSEEKMQHFIRPWLDGGLESRKSFIRQIRWADPKHTEEQEKHYSSVMESKNGGPKRLKIIWAEHDQWIPIERGEKLRDLTNPAEFVRVPDAGHLVLVDQPEIVMYELTTWLAKMTSSGLTA
jgi:pimeloyl-ACP methyl ester carboxylesterase